MKGSKGQFVVILILMLALVMQMEDILPDIFKENEEPIELTDEIDGMEFKAQIDDKSFSKESEVVIKATVINKSNMLKSYYAETTSYGMRGVLGAALVSTDEKSSFTNKFILDTAKSSSNEIVLDGMLEPGRELACNFYMLPFYEENGSSKSVTPGSYILSLWYNKDAEEVIKAEFPISVTKRMGKMYIKL